VLSAIAGGSKLAPTTISKRPSTVEPAAVGPTSASRVKSPMVSLQCRPYRHAILLLDHIYDAALASLKHSDRKYLRFYFGVLVTVPFSSWFYSYGNEARLISEATVDLAALDKLSAHHLDTAQRILSIRLEGTMIGLKAARSKLTQSQARQYSAIETRAINYLRIAKP